MRRVILFGAFLLLFSTENFAQIADRAEDICPLLVGETLPNEQVMNLENKPVDLLSVLKQKPTVLVFYRGGWCPYCNMQLAALAEAEPDILKLGYQIVAISPEDNRNIQPTIEKDSINYIVFSDPDGNLIQKVGIAFKTKAASKAFHASKTIGKVSDVTPVPAVMIVNTEGEILFEYINPNYKVRLSTKLLLAVLNGLEEE
jgi:peroxiredoxin